MMTNHGGGLTLFVGRFNEHNHVPISVEIWELLCHGQASLHMRITEALQG